MSDTVITVDNKRAKALEAAVSAGGAASVQEAVEHAVDAWLVEQSLANMSDAALQKLWHDGLQSGDAGVIDFEALKAQARAGAP